MGASPLEAATAPGAVASAPPPRATGRGEGVAASRAGDRLLEAAPFLLALALLAAYPAARWALGAPVLAELFRFAFLAFLSSFVAVNVVRAQRSRARIARNLDIDWMARLRSSGASPGRYFLLLPLKDETSRDVLARTFRSVRRLRYPKSLVTLVPVVEAEDAPTLEALKAVVRRFERRMRIEPLVYPATGLAVKCKATSMNAAGRWLAERMDGGELPRREGAVRVLVIDADTLLHPQDLAFREWTRREEAPRCAARGERGPVLQSLVSYTSNFWAVPLVPRLQSAGNLLYHLGKMQAGGDNFVLGPGMSVDLEDLRAVDFFEPSRCQEDMQFRYKVVLEGYRVAPLELPTWGKAPLTTRESFAQIARWARGALDLKFVARYRPAGQGPAPPLAKRKPFQMLRALTTHALAPLTSLLTLELILVPSAARFLGGATPAIRPFPAAVGAAAVAVGMVLAARAVRPLVLERPPPRWGRVRTGLEWARVFCSPLNIPHYCLIAAAQLYTLARLALGIPVDHAEVTRK
jgi:hypothetical protein